MNVISRRLIRDFYLARPERKRHAAIFDSWFRVARKAYWRNYEDVKATFGQTDVATGIQGRTATIFDIGGNKYRIVAHVDYLRQTVKIEAVMDHREYDRKLWLKLF
ncbi:MAG TPA: type II toxin-antitoxin system HigB family toxin [Tepidisphaeraceae bacterium]|nr:type II toxin-antitoxin system HigB family toxin [Tepidisphaeraceae bacterium]